MGSLRAASLVGGLSLRIWAVSSPTVTVDFPFTGLLSLPSFVFC